MIKARKLFLIPALGGFLWLIPYVGILLHLLVIYIWYKRNKENIHAYFRGYEHNKNEFAEDVLKEGV